MVFVFGVFRLARYLAPKQSWVGFLVMVSSGVLVLFFGYVESYSIIAAMLPYIFLAGLKAFDGNGSRINYLILCVLGALVHSVAVILFFPGLVVMSLDTKNESGESTWPKASVIC